VDRRNITAALSFRVLVGLALGAAATMATAAPMGLAVGARWTYQVRIAEQIAVGGPRSFQRTDTTTLLRKQEVASIEKSLFPTDGTVYVIKQTDTGETGTTPEQRVLYVEVAKNAIRELGYRNGGLEDKLVKLAPPDLSYKWPLKVGQSWESVVGVDRLNIKARSEVVEAKPLLVGKTSYDKAYRVDTTSSEMSGSLRIGPGRWGRVVRGSVRQTYWVVPNVGEVLWDDRSVVELDVPLEDSPATTVAWVPVDDEDTPTVRLTRTVSEHGEIASYTPPGGKAATEPKGI
jgi:hypothetical protein